MIIDPNSRLFDRVPDVYLSPYPADEAQASDAFDILMERARGSGQDTVGEAVLSQAGAQAWNQATQLLWKKKATLSGDVLGEVWGKVAWLNPKTDSIAGLLAEVPFGLTSDPAVLLSAMASVAVDLALNAVSAIPVAGWIIGIVVGIGRALASLFKGLGTNDPVQERARLPWGRYNRDVDQEWVRTFINIDGPGVDWTPMFAPPTKAISWSLLDGVEKDSKTVLGQVLAPFANKTVAYNGMYGCIPGTFRVAGLLQYRGRPQGAAESLRFYNDATLIQRYGDFTQTGDFFPALQQLAGATWQQVAAGGPDAYKVDCTKLESMWRDWFTALYTSAMDQGYGDYLLPYLAREVHGEWRLGANASGIIQPTATDGTPVPLVTDGTFKTGALATIASRTPCMFTEGEVKGVRVDGNDLARKWQHDVKTDTYTCPAAVPVHERQGSILRTVAARGPAPLEVPPGGRRDHHPRRPGRGAAPAPTALPQPRLRLRAADRRRRSPGLRRLRRPRQRRAARLLHRDAQAPAHAPRPYEGRVRDRARGRQGVRRRTAHRRSTDDPDPAGGRDGQVRG